MFGILLPLGRAFVALVCLSRPVRVPPRAEDRRLFLDGQQQTVLVGVDHSIQSGTELLEMLDPVGDLPALGSQGFWHVRIRVVQDGPDPFQSDAELAVDDDSVEAFQITGGVEPISGSRTERGPRQSNLIPVV